MNDGGARFCRNCGTPLQEALGTGPFQTGGARPTRRVAGERRVITMMFCDIKGSTTLAEQLDPEEWAEIMDGAFSYLIEAVTRYGGTIARLMGDAILAFFGAPVAHEDDPYRAVRAALDILHDIRPYQEATCSWLGQRGVTMDATDFQVRIGIHTGLVVVGRVGAGENVEYTAMGDAANLAARLEQTAQPGTIQISHDTFRLISRQVEIEALGETALRGKHEPVRTYRVLSLKAGTSTEQVATGMRAPMIGRDEEDLRLRQALSDLLGGEGQIVSLIGEAGLGKSRLVREMRGAWTGIGGRRRRQPDQESAHLPPADTPRAWFQVYNLSFQSQQPYGMLQRLIRKVSGIRQNEPPAAVERKLQRLMVDIPQDDLPPVERALEALFGSSVAPDGSELQGMSLKQTLHQGIETLWRARASQTPTVFVFEDVQWADPASVDLVLDLLPLCEEGPLLFLFVYRPAPETPVWQVREIADRKYADRYTELVLKPLSPEYSSSLVENLLRVDTLPGALGKAIIERAEGNPFYIEEIVRDLIERGVVARQRKDGAWKLVPGADVGQIPGNLQVLLAARRDRLDPDVRYTLQLAAVIGRSFYYRVLNRIAEPDVLLENHLETLQQAGMIFETSGASEREYVFRHALTQEAAYQAILIRDRRRHHQRVGEAIEQIFADELDRLAPVLAHHFSRAENRERALHYYALAAERASRLFANAEAIDLFGRAIELADQLSSEPRLKVDFFRGRALAHETMGRFELALADHNQAHALARQAGDRTAEWRCLLDLGKLWASQDYAKTGEYFQKALALSQEINDPASVATSLNRVGNWHVNIERPLEGIKFHTEAYRIFEEQGDALGIATTDDFLGMAQFLAGDTVSSGMHYDRAVAAFRKLDQRRGLVSSLTTLGILSPTSTARVLFCETPLEDRIAVVQEAAQLAWEMGWRSGRSYADWVLATIYSAQGRHEEALVSAHSAFDTAVAIQHRQWMAGAGTVLGYLYREILDMDAAAFFLERALTLAHEIKSGNWINLASAHLALNQILQQDLEAAAGTLSKVMDLSAEKPSTGQRNCWYAQAHLDLARGDPVAALALVERLIGSAANLTQGGIITGLWNLKGYALLGMERAAEAEPLFSTALQNAEKLGEKSLSWRLHAGLGHACRQLGRPQQAEEQIARARQIVAELAESIQDARGKEMFRTRAEAFM